MEKNKLKDIYRVFSVIVFVLLVFYLIVMAGFCNVQVLVVLLIILMVLELLKN